MRRLPRVLAAACACGLFAIAPFTATAAERQRPNVVIFLADDAGWGDFGGSGNPDVRTPQVDSLARDGVSLKWFFVQQQCH